ncbi:acetyltransferase, partial [Planctomycetota bacterium]|nr:acetyltransferase [Planctomycetota bacterium]
LLASAAMATDQFDPTQAVVHESETWDRVELLEDSHPALIQETFIPLLEHHQPEIVAAFGGNAAPPSSQFLLHYAPGWEEATHPVPVLLVHGAGVTADHSWGPNPVMQPGEGLAARLTRAGRKAIAITFAHPHGDNTLQAEALADAIARVLHVTDAEQVDLVAWSKGGMAARMYLSSAGPSWATDFRRDVRRYVMLGTPNGGIDVAFAYPNLNYWILEQGSPAPLSWTRCLYYGTWVDKTEQSIYARGGAFPGQAQMVTRWDDRYGRTRADGQFDIDTTYDGGQGLVSQSLGIDQAIEEGGHMIAMLERHGVHRSVDMAILAGTNAYVVGLVGERRGPSDGLLLAASVLHTEGLTRAGARVIKKDLRAFNHLQLCYDARANDWVVEALEHDAED